MPRLRFFWFLLALLLPIQLTWASAGAYCAHESNPGHAAHVGHHSHVHKKRADASPDQGQAALDIDCGVCHASCLPLLAAPIGPLAAPDFKAAHTPPQPSGYLSAQPRAPDRPRWPRLA